MLHKLRGACRRHRRLSHSITSIRTLSNFKLERETTTTSLSLSLSHSGHQRKRHRSPRQEEKNRRPAGLSQTVVCEVTQSHHQVSGIVRYSIISTAEWCEKRDTLFLPWLLSQEKVLSPLIAVENKRNWCFIGLSIYKRKSFNDFCVSLFPKTLATIRHFSSNWPNYTFFPCVCVYFHPKPIQIPPKQAYLP